MKIKNILFILAISTLIFSCKNDDNEASFDAAKQALEDDVALIDYLQKHYLNEADGGIWTIKNGETPLMEQVEVQNITKDDISYKLYYLIKEQGVGRNASKFDSVYVDYTGILLDSTVFDPGRLTWFDLTSVLNSGASGFAFGLENFKEGVKIINSDESFYFENTGKGILFMPSGLGYGSNAQSVIPENSPLIFEISLNSINESDHDNDGILSKDEDVDNDGDINDDDTDEDDIANYLDVDDDGDGKLTRDEDTNKNGNWFDDDADGDGIPNFLDKDS
ncbi:MAG: hypothetical protein A3F91_00130 [Flavobacteria bacterium RIFCSPLOWO2_12_FULL_35_11]|nr:MAG: hypothetical protein A3F91_00130 [Flavobacteria bacterium RIFCSPLOWO2_12_FULL_35_11]